jgi:hypothetical protein
MLQPADWGIGLWYGAWGETLPGLLPSTRNGPSLEARISTDGPFLVAPPPAVPNILSHQPRSFQSKIACETHQAKPPPMMAGT